MALPKIHSLTETDVKILLSLVQKQTIEELTRTSGVPYSYLRNRISKLKARNFIQIVGKDGPAPLYQTVRLPETEPLFELRATASPNGNLYRIPSFYGQNLTFREALAFVTNKRNELKGATNSLREVTAIAIALIKVRSYRRHTGEIAVQHPHEQEMRDILFQHIQQTERELRLAKELYETEFLWRGHENIWQVISEGEPKPGTLDLYKKANKIFS